MLRQRFARPSSLPLSYGLCRLRFARPAYRSTSWLIRSRIERWRKRHPGTSSPTACSLATMDAPVAASQRSLVYPRCINGRKRQMRMVYRIWAQSAWCFSSGHDARGQGSGKAEGPDDIPVKQPTRFPSLAISKLPTLWASRCRADPPSRGPCDRVINPSSLCRESEGQPTPRDPAAAAERGSRIRYPPIRRFSSTVMSGKIELSCST